METGSLEAGMEAVRVHTRSDRAGQYNDFTGTGLRLGVNQPLLPHNDPPLPLHDVILYGQTGFRGPALSHTRMSQRQ